MLPFRLHSGYTTPDKIISSPSIIVKLLGLGHLDDFTRSSAVQSIFKSLNFKLPKDHSPSLNRHINVVEGFECSNDPRGYVVWGLNAPGRVSHGKQALGDGSDK
ncbi:hypothetical protein AMECASPLE_023727 [Ameca splendens]|uniref:Uncharacterized protein n=1 Tax=Ameca splendens TaxID=208324 RepID=A0ABV0ZZP2_9TELE